MAILIVSSIYFIACPLFFTETLGTERVQQFGSNATYAFRVFPFVMSPPKFPLISNLICVAANYTSITSALQYFDVTKVAGTADETAQDKIRRFAPAAEARANKQGQQVV